MTKGTLIKLFSSSLKTDSRLLNDPDYNFLNKLKRTNREAFFYWWKCLEL